MKIIDAYWEKRNLGYDVVEVTIDDKDGAESISEGLASIDVPYCVVKVNSKNATATKIVQDNGYKFIEDMIHVSHDLHEVQRNRLHQRMQDASSYRPMDDNDIKRLFEEVELGMFSSDRITNDSEFTYEQSKSRYVNWLKDLIDQKALPYVILYKNVPCGFVILKTNDGKHYSSVLGASYMDFRNAGTGIIQKEQEIVKELGGKSVETSVSSNNPSQLRALMMNGYIPTGVDHVFIKHKSAGV